MAWLIRLQGTKRLHNYLRLLYDSQVLVAVRALSIRYRYLVKKQVWKSVY